MAFLLFRNKGIDLSSYDIFDTEIEAQEAVNKYVNLWEFTGNKVCRIPNGAYYVKEEFFERVEYVRIPNIK